MLCNNGVLDRTCTLAEFHLLSLYTSTPLHFGEKHCTFYSLIAINLLLLLKYIRYLCVSLWDVRHCKRVSRVCVVTTVYCTHSAQTAPRFGSNLIPGMSCKSETAVPLSVQGSGEIRFQFLLNKTVYAVTSNHNQVFKVESHERRHDNKELCIFISEIITVLIHNSNLK